MGVFSGKAFCIDLLIRVFFESFNTTLLAILMIFPAKKYDFKRKVFDLLPVLRFHLQSPFEQQKKIVGQASSTERWLIGPKDEAGDSNGHIILGFLDVISALPRFSYAITAFSEGFGMVTK